MVITPEEREKERAVFESERQRVPHLFDRPPMIDDPAFLKDIGIEVAEEHLPIGYIRYLPQDFIVELGGIAVHRAAISQGFLGNKF